MRIIVIYNSIFVISKNDFLINLSKVRNQLTCSISTMSHQRYSYNDNIIFFFCNNGIEISFTSKNMNNLNKILISYLGSLFIRQFETLEFSEVSNFNNAIKNQYYFNFHTYSEYEYVDNIDQIKVIADTEFSKKFGSLIIQDIKLSYNFEIRTNEKMECSIFSHMNLCYEDIIELIDALKTSKEIYNEEINLINKFIIHLSMLINYPISSSESFKISKGETKYVPFTLDNFIKPSQFSHIKGITN